MARNTDNIIPANNLFKPAVTTIDAAGILAENLSAYETLLRSLQNPTLSEQLRENDLNQVRQIIETLTGHLKEWLKLPNG